jgi:hypothetical protein
MRYRAAPALTAVQQFVNLKINPICKGEGGVRLGKLNWEFTVRPDPLSRLYRVRIEFRQGAVPQVSVIDPDLSLLAEGRKLPHVYDQTPAQLCLYLPGTGRVVAVAKDLGDDCPVDLSLALVFRGVAGVGRVERWRPASSTPQPNRPLPN